MNQLIYIFLIVLISTFFSCIYQLIINKNKFIKVFLVSIFILLFVYVCYRYNFFIFNFYVTLSIIIGAINGYIVKIRVKQLIKRK